ncbi:transporter associated domain-containing protein [Neptunomonas phycophila]|jgi:magnesium and cobalt transporter|uniref:Magnesium and cobalt efflux protein CorC n=1 Tax=Neptunomonas phycophila TaxID=1572645 RepID=A0AAW7XL77_9GAMM|nr:MULTISPECIES: transporter associated domain-containing protein [Neptunomonas]MBT3145422.1 CBS domain-containing protein [Neptunomonas phycophila]MDN2658195.1 CBS domain-containing protein [Neptunomonas sp. CHC150]MDO6455053.1 transporter associated domain-containing protein [Neptunomonas phycophila]MDO6468550.1 transporter associated domain-containing protein [Neptunomonas phycophila]MDO6785454.1 transporter associated domain-containing protein [Neptunomonas phycophila]
MSEDRSAQPRSWFGRLTQAFSDEPKTRQDVLELLREATEENVLDYEALNIIEGAMQVSEMQVRDIMIPRSQMAVVNAEQTPKEFLPLIISSAHSRFPVIGESPDEVIGVLLAKDLLPLIIEDNQEEFDIYSKLRKATFIPESKRLNTLLKEFRATRNHMAIVIDEYGSIAGLVTIEDVLEQIVGEIEDEHDVNDSEGNIRPFDENAYIVKALTEIEDFNEYFDASIPDDEFDTIGGIVTRRFGHLPRKDEEVTIDGFVFKVLSSDTRRIRLLQVKRK